MGYVDTWTRSDPLRRRLRRLTLAERVEEAREFLKLFHHEHELPAPALAARQRAAIRELRRDGVVTFTPDELAFGARVAWRNHANCIGRLYWKSLDVIDARTVTEPDAIARLVVDQLAAAAANGNSKPTITIFAPVKGDRLPAYIESRQAIQYAGYVADDGAVLGDPVNAEATRTAIALGWNPPEPRGRFDVLPLLVRDAAGRRLLYALPPGAVLEVPLTHPASPTFDALGLRWYGVPCVCDMVLTIGGVDFPCAPFNGFYMATEIASRNLIDEVRYDLLEPVADALGVARDDRLRRDVTLTELNRAVLHSFESAGVNIVDHHAASRQYLDFVRLEHAAARAPSANWAWIVPPQASAGCPVFHQPMTDHGDVPNFYRGRAQDGDRLHPARLVEQRGRTLRRLDRLKRRLRRWRRTAD